MKINQFIDELGKYNLTLSEKQLAQFERYFTLLVEWNEKMNLTAITEKDEVYLKHFFDSVTAGFYYDFNREISVCDVGAGAGFPSIPLKIMYPNIKVTIVDSLNKRITFLNELAKELELENTYFYHDRAETFGQNKAFREQFDVVTARAVARLSVLSELCLPLVKEGGQFVALKAANAADELKASERGIKTLGGEIKEIQSFTLPLEESERNVIIIDKVKQTPKKYPRKPGTPNKSPLE